MEFCNWSNEKLVRQDKFSAWSKVNTLVLKQLEAKFLTWKWQCFIQSEVFFCMTSLHIQQHLWYEIQFSKVVISREFFINSGHRYGCLLLECFRFLTCLVVVLNIFEGFVYFTANWKKNIVFSKSKCMIVHRYLNLVNHDIPSFSV